MLEKIRTDVDGAMERGIVLMNDKKKKCLISCQFILHGFFATKVGVRLYW